ncbi:uncharacterized protein CEXT_339811 [Caerostris extrusa]|uniref:DFDF domain-containing protein n=1 Tax=Caerostris extrusa TaxID=172846 RepID=A0AAV4XHL4_CAEEX|nr:uncharacterized protein CEXT_339811 [Caerostris extrusa]
MNSKKKQQQPKQKIVTRKDNLHQEGSVDFTTTNQTQFGQKCRFSGKTTNLSEYQQWQQQSKPEIVIRRDNLHQEGSVDYNTTHKTEFGKTISVERPHVVKPKGNLELEKGKFASETTTHSEFQQRKQQSKPEKVIRKDNLRQEGSVDFTTTHKKEFGKNVDSIERPRVTKPKGNLELEKGKFASETTTHSEFQQRKQQSKPEKVIRKDNLRQEGSVDFTTTHKTEFGQTVDSIERPRVVKPKGNLELEKGKFVAESTTQSEFQQRKQQSKPEIIIRKDNLRQEGSVDFTTTHKTEFGQTVDSIERPHRKQQSKPEIIIRKDNLRQEGSVDFTTTHKTEFGQTVDSIERPRVVKPKGNLELEKGEFASETTTHSEFQQRRQQSKPEKVIRKDNLRQEGSVDFTTTHKTEFGQTVDSIERPHVIKPKGNLELEKGKFASETTTHSEFQQRKQQSKPEIIIRKDNLQQDGSVDFTTTNQTEFGVKTIERVSEIRPKTNSKITGKFDGTTTNQIMFQDSPREKLQSIKPQNNLQLEKGNFASETTNKQEFQNWEYSKSTPVKPQSSMKQEGDIDFSTTNKREFVGKTAEKVSPIKPVTATKVSGKFEGTTTNQAMFQCKTVEKVKGKRPPTNIQLETGKFEDQTTNRREFQQWEMNRPDPIKPTGNLVQEGEMNFTTLNQTEFDLKSSPRVEPIRPHASTPVTGEFDGTTTNKVMYKAQTAERVHDIRPKDNLRVNSGQFVGETTNSKEFSYKPGGKSQPVKPKPNLKQEGDFDFTTSNQLQFDKKEINKVSQIRPKTLTKTSDGKFYSTTTNQAMFQTPTMETSHEKTTDTQVGKGKSQSNTTSYQLNSSLKQEGDMQFETTNKTEFKERNFDRVQQIRPKTTNKIEGEFDATTTNQVMFQQPENIQRAKPIRHENNLQLESGKFASETTNNREFRQWVKMENKDTINKRKSQAAAAVSQKEVSVTKTVSGSQSVAGNKEKSQYEAWKLSKESTEANVKERTVTDQSQTIKTESKSTIQNQTEGVNVNGAITQIVKSTTNGGALDINLQKHETNTRSSQKIVKSSEERVITAQNVSTETTGYGTKQTTTTTTKSVVPAGNLSNQGDTSFVTTSQTDFSRQTAKGQSQKSTTENVRATRPGGNLFGDGEMSFATTSTTDFSQQLRKSSGKQTNGFIEFSGNMTQRSPVRARGARSMDNLFQGGEMHFTTTSKNDFSHQNTSQRRSESRRMNTSMKETSISQLQSSPDNGIILNTTISRRQDSKGSPSKSSSSRDNSLSPQKTPTKTRPFKPEDNLKIDSVPFEATSTTRTEYKKWEGKRSSSKKRTESLKQEGSMEFDTTSKDYSLKAFQANRDSIKAK